MTESVFDVALNLRYAEAPEATAIEVTSGDTLLIRNTETGALMRMPVSILYTALGSAFASLIDGKVPASQLPSYVDDVLEYANFAALPGTGETGKIYVTLNTNLTYRWSGSAYVEISASLALGETSATAYRGDRGKTAYDHSQATGNPHGLTASDLSLGDAWTDTNSPATLAAATFQKFKSGVIQQCGRNTVGAESTFNGVYYAYVDITFQTPFSSTNYRIAGTTDRVYAWFSSVGNKTTTGCRLYATALTTGLVASTPIDWIAEGY